MLDFRILGPLEVADDGRPVRLGGPKQRATLAILLLNANRVVSIERLADDLYAGAAPATAVAQVQRQISELRKALGSADSVVTQAPGYVLPLSPGQLDLSRFEAQAEAAARSLANGEPERASDLFREALASWRGAPLADFTYELFAGIAIARLEEIRLAALEQRIEADLALGRHVALIAELEQFVREHPLRETLRAELMLAYYRAGRQVDALQVYRSTRALLASDFGIEPTPALQKLEHSILTQDPALDLVATTTAVTSTGSSILLVPSEDAALDALMSLGEPLAGLPERELIVARLVNDEALLEAAGAELRALRSASPVPTRTAAFTTKDVASDAARLVAAYDVQLVLVDAGAGDDALSEVIADLFERSPATVGVLQGTPPPLGAGSEIFVPFGGSEHDWAALEVSALLCLATGARLRLVGTRADPASGRRDASRLLADAALAVQKVVGVDAESLLAEADGAALTAAVRPATLVVTGVAARSREEGVSSTRRALLTADRPLLLVHRGPRPSGLAPGESRTRFSWSL